MGWKEFKEELKIKFEEGRKKGEELRKKKGEKNVQIIKDEPEE